MIKNEVMLITYADSIGSNLKDLYQVLNQHLKGVVGGIHILPFFPSSGDRGFAPMDYTQVDSQFGSWADVRAISDEFYLMVDFMVNHISRQSEYVQNFKKNKERSPYKEMFIQYNEFWPDGEPSSEDIDRIYKRKPRAPFSEMTFKDGSKERIWCTFDEEQIDLDVTKKVTRIFIKDQLSFLKSMGASIIRLDAFAYANKKIGTNCFFVEPEVWELLSYCDDCAGGNQTAILPEIHEHYSIQKKIADKGYYVYDFALPMLVLHALYSGKVHRLIHWLSICPRKQFTTLDTHDGIGVVDAKDLLTETEIEMTKESLYTHGANVKRIYSSESYNNLDIYQINCTFYSALGNDDRAYLLARVLQIFAPGIPQIYYVGLFAGENDIDLLEETKEGRNINRHYYSLEEIEQTIKRPVVQELFKLLRFRNKSLAFDGDFSVKQIDDNILRITWTSEEERAILEADLSNKQFCVSSFKNGKLSFEKRYE